MTYSSKTIANYYLIKGEKENIKLTPQKLVKLVCCAHGWSLGLYDRPLIQECVVNNGHGPMLMDLIYTLYLHAGENISHGHRLKECVSVSATETEWQTVPAIIDDEIRPMVDKVWDEYKIYDGGQLSTMLNREGSAARKAWENRGTYKRCVPISEESIQAYYKELIEQTNANKEQKY